ncbi:unnamed protein product [Caenorhabditis bovis]|uniref:T20D4.11-like domain-containing protein n=1 Tax=Caenorhabditis bovis TaxID=2654633 RepID=A0A8S1EY00_9PELO|nr:unnamed protein product [Caenorhabditis bovis]
MFVTLSAVPVFDWTSKNALNDYFNCSKKAWEVCHKNADFDDDQASLENEPVNRKMAYEVLRYCHDLRDCYRGLDCELAETEKMCESAEAMTRPFGLCVIDLIPTFHNEAECDGYFRIEQRHLTPEQRCKLRAPHRDCVVEFYKRKCGETAVLDELNRKEAGYFASFDC